METLGSTNEVSCSGNVSTYLSVTPPESETERRIRKRNRHNMEVDVGPEQLGADIGSRRCGERVVSP